MPLNMETPTMLKKLRKKTRKATMFKNIVRDFSSELISRRSPGIAWILRMGLRTRNVRRNLRLGASSMISNQLNEGFDQCNN